MNDMYKESKNKFNTAYDAIMKFKELKLFSAIFMLSLFGIWLLLYFSVAKQVKIPLIIFVVSTSFIGVILITMHKIIVSKGETKYVFSSNTRLDENCSGD